MPTVKMRPSRTMTINLPVVGTGNSATLTHAANMPVRIVVRNIGGSIVFVAHMTNALEQIGSTQDCFQIPVGGEDTFILAPEQAIYASAAGPNGNVCVAISEAWPFLEG